MKPEQAFADIGIRHGDIIFTPEGPKPRKVPIEFEII
jgi:hypothetical protein